MGLKKQKGKKASGEPLPPPREVGGSAAGGYVIKDRTTRADCVRFKDSYEKMFGTPISIKEGAVVEPGRLIPTQHNLIEDELDVRREEVKNSTEEPIIVLRALRFGRPVLFILEGHHRYYAACEQNRPLKAFVLEPETLFEPPFPTELRSHEDLVIIRP